MTLIKVHCTILLLPTVNTVLQGRIMKLIHLFEGSIRIPNGNWFNVKTGQHTPEYGDEHGGSGDGSYAVPHVETMIFHWEDFGFDSLEDAEDSVEDAMYEHPYATGWVRWVYIRSAEGPDTKSVVECTSHLNNFRTPKGKMELHRLATMYNPTNFLLSDRYSASTASRQSTNYTGWSAQLDVATLREKGKFVDLKGKKVF